jgi:hypothetical protein
MKNIVDFVGWMLKFVKCNERKEKNIKFNWISVYLPFAIKVWSIINSIEFIHLCVQKIFKTVLNILTQLCCYLNATCFGLYIDHHQAKNCYH